MKNLSRFALLSVLTATICGPVFAATNTGDDLPKGAVSKPLSAWLVGPSQASAFDAKDHPEEQGCLMVTEFDNGMILGVHARKAGIVGMTVDTKIQSLAPGDARAVGVNAGQDAYVVNATATDASTLALNLDEAGGGKQFAERLTGLGSFRLLIDEKPYYFSTTGFTDGLARLQVCMGSTMAVPVVVTGPGDTAGKVVHDTTIETMKVTSSGHETPLALAMPNLVPTGYRFFLEDVDPMTPVSWQAGDDWVVVMQNALQPHGLKMVIKGNEIRILQRAGESEPVIEDAQIASDEVVAQQVRSSTDVPEGVWGGAKGESLASVLEAWGLMAGVNVQVDLMGDLTLPDDVRFEGRFDEAVQKLLSQFNGKDRPTSAFKGMNTTAAAPEKQAEKHKTKTETTYTYAPRDNWKPRAPGEVKKVKWDPVTQPGASLKQMRTIPDPADAPKTVSKKSDTKKSASKTKGTWEALEGTSLRDVLEHWGQDAGVDVVWLAQENYPLPETIRKKGKFEEVVMEALAQFEGQGTRPVAQLNQDPNTGDKALIVKSKRF